MPNIARGFLAFLAAAAVALGITAYGQGLWGLLALANIRFHPELPWAAILMAGLLALLLLYLSGAGWPQSTRETRRRLLRWNAMPWPVFGFALFTGVLALVALGGIWIATSDLIRIPPGITPSVRGLPAITVASLLVMGSLAAPLSEEAAFRGYAQGILERAWTWAPAAIVGSSILFAAAHVTQGLFLPKLALYFLAGLIFGSIAWATNSLYASMVVHCLADLEGFLLLWPHDARPHALVSEGGHDPLLAPAVAAVILCGPLCFFAFRQLARMTKDSRKFGRVAAVAM